MAFDRRVETRAQPVNRYVAPNTTIPDWGVGNVIDPTGFIRTLSVGGNPFQRDPFGGDIQPTGPGTDPAGYGLPTEDEVNNFIAMIESSGIPAGNQRYYIQRVIQHPEMLDELFTTFNQDTINAENRGIAEQEQKRVEGYRRDAQKGLDALDREIRPGIVGDVRRFSRNGTTLDPNFIFRDPTYAGEMSAADAAINANIQREREGMGAAFADSGVVSSGKGSAMVGSAQNQGAFDKGRLRSDLYGRAEGEFQGALGRQRDFSTQMNRSRADVNAGYAPYYADIAGFARRSPVDYYQPRGTAMDEYYGRKGMDLAYGGLAVDAASSAAGSADNALNSFGRIVRPGG